MYTVKKHKQKPAEQEQHDTHTQAFLREVDDALHQENMLNLWHQWKYAIGITIIGLFVIVGGNQWWKQRQLSAMQTAADAWYSVATAKNKADSSQIETLAKGKVLGAKIMAVFEKARAQNSAGNSLEASKTYELVAKDSAVPTKIQELAKFYSALVLISSHPAEAESKLVTMDTEGHAYRASALEMLAELAENRNDKAKALALWEKLREIPNVPSSIRTRASQRAEDMKAAANIK